MRTLTGCRLYYIGPDISEYGPCLLLYGVCCRLGGGSLAREGKVPSVVLARHSTVTTAI